MSLLAYIVLALINGAAVGTCLGYLMNADRNRVGELRRWLAVGGVFLVLVLSYVASRFIGDLYLQAMSTKALAVLSFVGSFALALSRWKLVP